MDILKSSQLVIFSYSTIFITFSFRSLAGFLFKLLRSSRRRKPEVATPLCGSDISELHIHVLYAYVNMCTYTCIYARICLFVIHFHKFLYMEHCCQARHVIFMGMKKASKRNLHIVKTLCRWMKAIIFWVFDHFVNSLTTHYFFDTCLILS